MGFNSDSFMQNQSIVHLIKRQKYHHMFSCSEIHQIWYSCILTQESCQSTCHLFGTICQQARAFSVE